MSLINNWNMKYWKNSSKIIFCIVVIIAIAVVYIRVSNLIAYKELDLKEVCGYKQNTKSSEIRYLCNTDEAVCVIEYIRENGYVKEVQISSFCKYLSNPEKNHEILYYDAAKWALDSSLTEQVLYDTKYRKESVDYVGYGEISNGECLWYGPKGNKKFMSPGILQTTTILQARYSMTEIENLEPFYYAYKR